jgi:hypothetical protein
MLEAYWKIDEKIVLDEQNGKHKAHMENKQYTVCQIKLKSF